jgi:hypothetical protein
MATREQFFGRTKANRVAIDVSIATRSAVRWNRDQ